MEDQQPDPGDLTNAESPDQPADVESPAQPADVELPAQPADVKTPTGKAARRRHRMPLRQELAASHEEPESEPEAAAEETADEEQAEEQILVPHRPAGKRLTIAAVAAGVVFVGATAFAGATLQPYLADRALVNTKLDIAKTAANGITTLWTYTPENMDGLADRAQTYLSGDFAAQYRKFVDAIVAPNKQAKISNNTQVAGVGIESLDDQNAVVIVYTNTTSTSPLTKNIPSLKYLSYRLFMKRNESRWLVTRMTTITSLDLTPRV